MMPARWFACLIGILAIVGQAAANPAAASADNEYAGSAACEGCHTWIYNNWRSTRHSHSVKTGREAQQAGYPLPQRRRGGAASTIDDWADVSYVIGGRQRIAYADSAGRVQDTSFHHRVGRWDVFPTLEMKDCIQCHYTGVGAGVEHPPEAPVPGRWVERNIGCEACHGPGARHVETLEKTDIRKDPSSRVCGQCHTAVGKILPKGELHATHDLVQNWNQDRHVTGVQRQSHDAFCSSCHSPYDGQTQSSLQDAARRVFTEQKQNITCIGCHDPHRMTHPAYDRESVVQAAPLPIRAHTFTGNDDDFTTTDHREWDSAAASCLACHRGADRVDLDHADASCVDCHNTYKRNHGPESRQFHDTNRAGLSCLGCHDNADYLMSILYQDPDFLDPKHIHNLRKLPAVVQARYGFRYRDLRPGYSIAAIREQAVVDDNEPRAETGSAAEPARPEAQPAVHALLAQAPHRQLAGHADLRPWREMLLERPGSPAAHLRLARAYAELGEAALARELIELAFELDSSRVLLELPLLESIEGDRLQPDTADGSTGDGAAAIAAELLPREQDALLRTWLQAYLEIGLGRYDAAAELLEGAAANATIDLYRALAALGGGHVRRARSLLEAGVETYPRHHALRAALGLVHMRRKRAADAEAALRQAITLAPGEGGARVLLGQLRIRNDDTSAALQAFRDALEVEPALLEARFFMARAYQLDGRPAEAVKVYEELIDREPDLFEARYALANLLKLWSDQLAFRLRAERESNPPPGTSRIKWRAGLDGWQRQAEKMRDRALAELAVARQLRPGALDVVRQVAEIYRVSNRLDDARRFYQWLIERQPEVWLHRYRLGTVWYALGRYDEAVDALTRVTVMAPTDGDARLALGLALVRAGRLEQAIAAFEKATTYEPFNPGLYANLGAAYASRGDLEKARQAFERSLELRTFPLPRVHLTQTNLALVHLRAGRSEEAITALRRALHGFADYPLARELLEQAERYPDGSGELPPFVYNEWLERFGEVTTVAFANE